MKSSQSWGVDLVASVEGVTVARRPGWLGRLWQALARRPQAAAPAVPAMALIEAMSIPAAVLNAAGRLVLANAAWRALSAATDGVPAQAPLGGVLGSDYLAACGAAGETPTITRREALQWGQAVAALLHAGAGRATQALAGQGGALAGRLQLSASALPGGGVLLQLDDLGALRQLQARLSESEARRRATFDTPAVGMAENGLDGRWISINPRLCEITGYSAEQLRRMDFRALTHPDDRKADLEALQRLLDGEVSSVSSEKRYLRADGSVLWVSRTSSMVRDEQGGPDHVVSVINDISQYKRVQAELAEHRARLEEQVAERTRAFEEAMDARLVSERFLRSVADNLPDMVCYWGVDGVCRFANRAYRQWFGLEGHDIVGRRREDLLTPQVLESARPAFDAACAGRAGQWQYSDQDAEGRSRYLWVHFVPDRMPLPAAGDAAQGAGGDAALGPVVGVFVLASDVTVIKASEMRLAAMNEQLVAARDRAEQASRAKTLFLANVSHEIRTPMNAIIGLTHLMQRDLSDDVTQARLDKVSAAAHHLLDVINDVLDLSKIESGKLRIAQTDFAIGALLSRVCALVGDRVRGKGLALQVHAEGLPPVLRGDPTRVSQALLNLMSNAVKFTDHGSIELRCEREAGEPGERSLAGDGEVRLRFTVRDTGIGVPADRVGQLFNAFEQADASTTRRFGGTGLGLAITRRLAELMGGEVGVRSAPGQGSEFWFSARFAPPVGAGHDGGLPAEPPALATEGLAEVRARHEHQLRARHLGARVLLAEDNLINQEVAGELLRAAGLTVDVAANGTEAVALAAGCAYDLILMDMQMPEMDGLSATRQIRLLPAHARTPILAMTANAFGDDRQACLDAGMDDHLAKPVDPVLMYAMLDRWLPLRGGAAGQAAPAPAAQAAGAAPTEGVQDGRWAGIPGLTMSRALMFLPGRSEVYERVLRQFCEHYADGLEGVEAALAAGRWTALRQSLHSLRGACGAVGAVGIATQCRAAESLLEGLADGAPAVPRTQLALQSLQADLADLVRAVCERLQAPRDSGPGGGASDASVAVKPVAGPASGADSAAADPALDGALAQLQALLEAADFRSGALFRELEPALARRWGAARVAELARPLRQHDYEAALRLLQALLAAAAPAPRAAQ